MHIVLYKQKLLEKLRGNTGSLCESATRRIATLAVLRIASPAGQLGDGLPLSEVKFRRQYFAKKT